jgi:hypothetical protein
MKELSNDLFFPIISISIFVVAIYSIKYKDPSESWANYQDSTILYPDPVTIPKSTSHGEKCECPVCPQVAENIYLPSYQNYVRDYRVLSDPLYPPEQRSDSDYYYPREITYNTGGNRTNPNQLVTRDNPQLYGNGYFRYPTRGYPPPYQMKGYLVDQSNPDNIISLFGRPKYLGSTEFQYYVSKRDLNNNEIKIDIPNKREIYNDDTVKIKKNIFNGEYKFVEYKTEELIQPPLY